MPNVIVDTNVLVRALLRPGGSDWRVFDLAMDGKIALWYSHGLLTELARVFTYTRLRKYDITRETAATFIEMIVASGNVIVPQSTILCRDPDDNEILGIALAVAGSEPVYLVSADKDLLALRGSIERVTILTPQDFLKLP
ncbi:MAG: putative toxin-antitoxin system toxin component, PIN family [Candidatus Gottesmanbacteria bacterium]|nr:putative toxin-antitoxin system toxin component, PIN family [Candidatus Gottesmanbacteria bacterium]